MMASSKDELTSDSVGLGNGDPSNHELSSDENTTTCESTKLDQSVVSDTQDNSKNNVSGKNRLIEMDTETNVDIPPHDESMQTAVDCDEAGKELCGGVGGDKNEEMIGGEAITADSSRDKKEDNTLLSEISDLVDKQQSEKNNCPNGGEAGNKIDSHVEDANDNVGDGEPMEMDVETTKEGVINGKNTNLDDSYTPKEMGTARPTSEVKKPKESAIQRLASLGIIAEEKPVVEDKETILKKLASRGGISIMPAGSVPSSVNSPVLIKPALVKPVSVTSSSVKPGIPTTVSVKPAVVGPNSTSVTPSKPSYKPGPKSAKKKIKIDPGKSMDIDKDFNSLINFLSTGTGAEVNSTSVTPSASEEKNVSSDETVSEKVNDSKPETQLEINETSNQSVIEEQGSEMDVVDTNDDRSFLESESESHDGSKFEHSSETDEKPPMINKNKNVIEEGSAEILLSANKNVFYNKVQEFNRDMSIAALTVFSEMHQQDPRTRNRGKKRKAGDSNEADSNHADGPEENVFEAGKKSGNGITILEALSATGLRSIRYAREIPGVKEVIANDLSEDAVDTIKKNVEHNCVEDMVTTSMSDASLLMYQRQASQEWYDAVDLDPYGCPARFLDAAVQAVRDGGLLLVTCTDMAILAGNAPETCYVKYGAVSLRMPACHEMALRIALQSIESHANRYGRYIVPLLSFSADFYIRLIVQVYTSPVTCKRTTSKLAMVYQCVGCGTHSLHPLGNVSQVGHNSQPRFSLVHGPPVGSTCFHCHNKHNIGGPIWTAPLYSTKFVESMLRVVENGKFGTAKRMQGMLEVLREELLDVPLYYTVAGLCTKLHCQAIPLIDIRSAILNAGYRVSSSHASATAVKTNAPSKIIWDIMRCWVHMNPVSQKRLVAGSVPAAIILEPPNLIANFDIHPRARPSSATRKLLRYQQNPEKNWGPGTRARCNNAEDTNEEKRRINQNKSKNKKHIDIIEVVTIDDEDETTDESKMETATTPTPSTEKE